MKGNKEMYTTPEIEISLLEAEDILSSSLGPGEDIWDDGKPGDNPTEDDEL